MKTLEAIIEDTKGNVVGAMTSEGVITVSTPFPRSELASKARELALAHGVEIPAQVAAKLPPDGTTPK